jgi:hypothetical protein
MSQTLKIGVFLILAFAAFFSPANAQYYAWCDSIPVTTSAIDSTFDQRWEAVTVKFEGCGGYIKYGAPDYAGWSSRKWLYLAEGEPFYFGYRTPLVRLEFFAASGTGALYMAGDKRRRQYK